MLFPKHKTVYLYENGNLCLDRAQTGATANFIVSAVIVEPADERSLSDAVQAIRSAELEGAQLEAKAVGHGTRFRILRRLLEESFQVMYVLLNKNELYLDGGRPAGESVLNAVNKTLFGMLQRSCESLRIVFDAERSAQFLPGFKRYIEGRGGLLFSPYQFDQKDSGRCDLLQLSDFVAGTLKLASEQGAPKHHAAYLNFLRDKITCRTVFPRSYEEYLTQAVAETQNFDGRIAQWSIRAAVDYVWEHEDSNVPEELNRVIVTDRLLFQLQVDPGKYLGTSDLRKLIRNTSGYDYSDPQFRAQVIAPLRDAGLLISSSARGYKIPLTVEEVLSYSLHTLQMVYPMLERLKKCRDAVLEATNNELDILEQPQYENIRAYFDAR